MIILSVRSRITKMFVRKVSSSKVAFRVLHERLPSADLKILSNLELN